MEAACPTTDPQVREIVDQAPPLSPRQRELLKLIFATARLAARQSTEAA